MKVNQGLMPIADLLSKVQSKRPFKALAIKIRNIFLGALIIIGCIYIFAEVLTYFSYENYQKDKVKEAIKYSRLATLIKSYIYPLSSSHFQNALSYDLNLISNLDTLAGDASPYHTFIRAELSRLNLLNTKNSITSAQILLNAAKIENNSGANSGIDLAKRVLSDKELNQIVARTQPLIYAELKEEEAYSNLIGFYASLTPKNSSDVEINILIEKDALLTHESAQKTICKFDSISCEFNKFRWKLAQEKRNRILKNSTQNLFYGNESLICNLSKFSDCYIFKKRAVEYFTNNIL